MNKESRIELNLHTQMSDGLINPRKFIQEMVFRGYHAVAITDLNSVQAFPEVYKAVRKYNENEKKKEHFKVLYGAELDVMDDEATFRVTIIVRNKQGLKHLYELISLLHTKYAKQKAIPIDEVGNKSEGLFIGATARNGEIEYYLNNSTDEELANKMLFYDYIEINPLSTDTSREKIERIVHIANQYRKLVVATTNIRYLDKNDINAMKVLCRKKETDVLNYILLTTEQLLEKFSFLGEEIAYNIVVKNPNIIENMCEELDIFPEKMVIPEIQNGDIKLARQVYQKAHTLYGNKLPEKVANRIAVELYGSSILQFKNPGNIILLGRKMVLKKVPECAGKGLIGANHEGMYLIVKMLIEASQQKGYKTESRGTVGSSFVAYLLGITEVNPLPLHYRCPKCKCLIFPKTSVMSGFLLKDKTCPNCNSLMKKDGHNIPYASFLGVEASLLPDININFSDIIVEKIEKEATKQFGKENVIYPGVIGAMFPIQAELEVEHFCHQKKETLSQKEKGEIMQKLVGRKERMGIYPGGLLILPPKHEITEVTPIEYLSGHTITHFDYHDCMNIIPKFGLLGHTDLTMLKEIEKNSKIDIMDIPFDDKNVFELLKNTKPLQLKKNIEIKTGTLGLPEFYFWKGMEELKKIRKLPKNFSECVKVLGLSHGTGTWEENALELLKQGISLKDVIAHREDIMNKLLEHSFSYDKAFEIMEFVRKGKCKKEPDNWSVYKKQLKEAGIEDWYIASCEKILYLFPKAHHISYLINIYRFMYAKIYEPEAFYKAYLKIHDTINLTRYLNRNYEEVKQELIVLKEKSIRSKEEQLLIDTGEVILEALGRNIDLTSD